MIDMKGTRTDGKPWGYNGSYHNPEYIRKQSESKSGSNHWNWKGGVAKSHIRKYAMQIDYLFSAENMNKMRVTGMRSKEGADNPMFGRKHSEESRVLMRQKKVGVFDGSRNPNWLGGISSYPYNRREFNKILKEHVRKRDNHNCQECSISQPMLIDKNNRHYKLIVHHIDYNKNNNAESNLISLCRRCHVKTNYNRNRWIAHLKNKIGGGLVR